MVDIHTGLRGTKITDKGVICLDSQNNEVMISGKTVICALGQRARVDVVEELRDTVPFVSVIGDCNQVATITQAVYQGYHAALDI